MNTAGRLARVLLGHDLIFEQKKKLGPVVHYAFAAKMCGLYGAAAEVEPRVTGGFGTAFATALWLGADEIAVSALGLSEAGAAAPLSSHAYALASHWVYGATAEAVRRGARGLLR